MGLAPRISSAQGYVDHAQILTDPLGLKPCDGKVFQASDKFLREAGAKSCSKFKGWLNERTWPFGLNQVYEIRNGDKVIYVGIANDIERLRMQHNLAEGLDMRAIESSNADGFTRRQARSIEQALMNKHKLVRSGSKFSPRNLINSIASKRDIYKDAVKFGNHELIFRTN